MIEIALAVSLWVNACIDGTLHGQPKTICHEFQIRSYADMETCARGRARAVVEWAEALRPYQLDLRLKGSRCGPAEADGDDI